ncbi:MAG: hypothetical protein WDO13_05390 [Verrucomicrobiota bacterium]
MIAHPVFVGELRAGLDAEQDVVRLGVVLAHVVDVVGRDDLQPELLRVLAQLGDHDLLLRHAVVGDLEVKVARREDRLEVVDRFLRVFRPAGDDVARDLAGQARAGADETARMLREDFLVDARLVVHALEVRRGDELDQVAVALLVLGQEQEMSRGLPRVAGLAVQAAARREVDLAPDDRLDVDLAALLVKFDRAEEIAVVAQGQRGHLQLRRSRGQLRNPARTVEQAVLGVDVEMDEGFRRGHSHQFNGESPDRRGIFRISEVQL